MTLDEAAADLLQSCSEKNWDGYDAPPVKKETIDRALMTAKIIAFWLPHVPEPGFAVCPDGSVDLDWYEDNDHLLNWCIDPDLPDVWVYRNGDEKSYGTFKNYWLDTQLMYELLNKLYPEVLKKLGIE